MRNFIYIALVFLGTFVTATAKVQSDQPNNIDTRSIVAASKKGQPMLVNLVSNEKSTIMSLQYDEIGYCISSRSAVMVKMENGTDVVLRNLTGTDCRVGAMLVVKIEPDKVAKLKASPIKSITLITDDGEISPDEIQDPEFFVRCFKK